MRQGLLIAAAGGAAVLVLLAISWSLRPNAAVDVTRQAGGSLLHPDMVRDAPTGYILAELYQDVRMDIQSAAYDEDGILQDSSWSYDAQTGSCSVDLAVAEQHGADEIAPTATPQPLEPTATSGPVEVLPAIFDADATPGSAPLLPDRTVVIRPTAYLLTPTAHPTATPRVIASARWQRWDGRPVMVDSDGLAALDAPRDAEVAAYVSLRMGADSNPTTHTELARMPLPEASWSEGSHHIDLPQSSGRVLLTGDDIDATYRVVIMHIEIAPLTDCSGLRLRWLRPAALVVRALADDPYREWHAPDLTVPTPTPDGVALRAAIGPDLTFAPADFFPAAAANSGAVDHHHITLPDAQDFDGDSVIDDEYIAFAVRTDLYPQGISVIRQHGSEFNFRPVFNPLPVDPDVTDTIDSGDFHVYVSQHLISHELSRAWEVYE